MMDTNAIIGLDSAYVCAQETGSGNMQISAGLVVELIDRLRATEATNENLSAAPETHGLSQSHSQQSARIDAPSELVKQLSVPYPHPRISEQDAREIIEHFCNWTKIKSPCAASKSWLEELGGRELLAKLNAEKADSSGAQQSDPNLLTWLPSLLNHYEKQARLNGFTPDTSLEMVRAALANVYDTVRDCCPSHEREQQQSPEAKFIQRYCERSGLSVSEVMQTQVCLPCSCSDDGCEGFAMVSNNPLSIKAHNMLYGRRHESEQHSFGESEFIPVDLLLKPDLTDEDVESWRKQNLETKLAAVDEVITMLRRRPLPNDPFIKSGFSEAIVAVVTLRQSMNQERVGNNG